MRRPHPRFDARRNAWVTNAGGRLKILVTGPQNSQTEAAAWDAFYGHMIKLGQPVETPGATTTTLGALADEYGRWMDKEVAANRMAPKTREYYVPVVQKFLDAVGGRRVAQQVLPIELERFKTGWHSVQAIQRLFNWGVEMGLLQKNQFKGLKRPKSGMRRRILTPTEMARLLRAADRHFRQFLLAQRQTIARPQEIRALQWKHFIQDPVPAFVLQEFKGLNLRKDDHPNERVIPLDDRMVRLLKRLAGRHPTGPNNYVFLNRFGQPWTGNAVRCRMRRLRTVVGLLPDERGEKVVAYTLRHTGATRATARGVRDRTLADLMGHTSTTTTSRYQHLQREHLHAAIIQSNRRAAQ